MAIRKDEVQLDISFITDESKQLAKTLTTTQAYTRSIQQAETNIKKYNAELAKTNISEAKRAELLQKIAEQEKIVATNLRNIAAEGQKVEKLDLSKLAPQQLIDRARQLEATLKRIPQSAPQFAQLQRELAGVNTRLSEIRNAGRGAAPGGGGGFGSLLSLAGRAVPQFAAAAAAFEGLKSAVTGASKLEQLTTSFEVFLGSAEKAKSVIADLKAFEVETPFEAEQVNSAGRALLAFGFSTQELIPTLRSVGDVAAGTGKDFNELALIYGKARAQGLIQGEELNQLAEAGIPIYAELAKVLGVNESQIRKLGEQGKIQFSDLEEVFKNLTAEGGRFNNLMQRQSQSIGGLYSTLKSVLSNTLADIGTALSPAIKDLVSGAITLGTYLGKVLVPVFQVVGASAQGLVWLFRDIGSFIGAIPGAIDRFIAAGQKIPVLGPAFDLVRAQITVISDLFNSIPATISGVKAAITDLFTNFGRNVGQAYTEARNEVLQEEARARAEEARDDRQLPPAEKKAIQDEEKRRAEIRNEARRKEQQAAAERAKKAFETALAKAEAQEKAAELQAEARRLKRLTTEEQYQEQLSSIAEQGLKDRLKVYERFGKQEENEATELRNRLLEIQAARADRAGFGNFDQLGARNIGGPASDDDGTQGRLDRQGIASRAGLLALRNRFEQALITEQDYEFKRLELKRAAIDEEIAILRAATQPQIEEIRKREEEKAKIEEKLTEQRVENQRRAAQIRQEIEDASFAAAQGIFSSVADLLLSDEQNKKKHANAIKLFQKGEVIVSAISEAAKIRSSVAAYPFPANVLLATAQSAQVLFRAAAAINRIENTKFAAGGYTGSGYGSPDETGYRPAGVVHEGEYVVPKWMVRQNSPVIRFLESRRLRGYADGGFVTLNTTPTAQSAVGLNNSVTIPGLQAFTRGVEIFSAAVANFPREARARVVFQDIEKAADEIGTIREEASL